MKMVLVFSNARVLECVYSGYLTMLRYQYIICMHL